MAIDVSDGTIYAAVSQRDLTPEEREGIERAILDSSAVLYPLEPLGYSQHNAEIVRLSARLAEATELLSSIVSAWDWWRADTYDRFQSVPGDAIDDARAFLKGATLAPAQVEQS